MARCCGAKRGMSVVAVWEDQEACHGLVTVTTQSKLARLVEPHADDLAPEATAKKHPPRSLGKCLTRQVSSRPLLQDLLMVEAQSLRA